MSQIRWTTRRTGNGSYEGTIILPTSFSQIVRAPGNEHVRARRPDLLRRTKPIAVTARGPSKAHALAQAASVASRIANNPLLQAALPPGSSQAIKAIDYLSKSAAAGKLASASKKIVGKGAKRLAKALKFW